MEIDGHVIGVCSWSLRVNSMAELGERVAETGLSHAQLHLNPLVMADDKRKHHQLGALRHSGLRLTAGMISFPGEDYTTLQTIHATGGLRPDDGWQARKALVRQAARVASELHLTIVTFHCGFIPAASDPFYPIMVQRVSEVADEFKTFGVDALMETGQESAPTLAHFLDDTGRTNLGVNFDPANMILYASGDPLEAIRLLGPRVRHVHVKDAIKSDQPGVTWGREVPFGAGEVGPARFLKTLHEAGYAGPLCIEREAGASRIADVRTAIDSLQKAAAGPYTPPPAGG